MADLNGRTVCGFRILRTLKSGAQGTVYEAVCEQGNSLGCVSGAHVAIKAMSVQDESGSSFAELQSRTSRIGAIDHPNVVKYHGCFMLQDAFAEMHLVVMDYLDGETLKDRLAREVGGLDADAAVRIIEAVVSGLDAAAAKGVCHRDVKPSNIFLCRNGEVKLIDFEVAKVSGSGTTTSSSGRLFGSFDYMAPDFTDPSFSGDIRSDVFSVGVVFHEMLSGALPYRKEADAADEKKADFAFLSRWARNPDGSFVRHVIVVATRIRRIVAHVDGVFGGALNPDREKRFADFKAFQEALGKVRFRDLRVEDRAYRLLRYIGKGGFGEVFKARLRSTGQFVAVKHLLNPDDADRFYREAKIMAQLRDPCFVRFIDFLVTGRSSNKDAFIVMAFLPGMPGNSLKDAIRRKPDGLPKLEVLTAFARYAHGLHVMHARGIYHRDIKPANLYYPDGRPGDAAIMDLGIARDINGTVTTGSVPGTFDYMPPEVVVQKNRGEAGMDVYALGLCLYEALTGGTAYPRLPRGYAAYAQFFKRAQTLEKPNLTSPIVTGVPALLELIREMTEPDVALRITDAEAVEKRLQRLVEIETNASGVSLEEARTAADTTVDVDEASIPTLTASVSSVHNPASPPPAMAAPPQPVVRRRRTLPWRRIAFWLVLGAAVTFVSYVAYTRLVPVIVAQAARGWEELSKWWRDLTGSTASDAQKIAAERVEEARKSADSIIWLYESEAAGGTEKGDARFETWKQKWRGVIPDDAFNQIGANVDKSRQSRIARDMAKKERLKRLQGMSSEAKAVLAAYGANDIARGDDLRAKWDDRWRKFQLPERIDHLTEFDSARTAAAVRVEEIETFKKAERAGQNVIDAYDADGLELADKMRTLWIGDWKEKLKADGFATLSKRIGDAREKCLDRRMDDVRKSRAAQIQRECAELCSILEPVEFRSSRLDDAMRNLEAGRSEGVLSQSAFDRLSALVRAQRKHVVFTVVNKSDHDVVVGTTPLANGDRKTFSFTNAVPDGFSIRCLGYEPIPLGAESNERTISLTPEYLVLERVDVTVPKLEDDVTCSIDSAPVRPGVVKILPGAHECLYMRKGYENQAMPFLVEAGRPVRLPSPGPWMRQ